MSGDAGAGGEPPVDLETTGGFTATGSPCGIGYDHTQDTVWVYPCSGASILSYSTDGTPLGSVDAPGEAANDVDLDFSAAAFSLSGVAIAEGTLLFVNGESLEAEVYAVDKTNGDVLTTLVTDFGASHVVGGAFHSRRGSLFLIEDRVAAPGNLVGEINPQSGLTISSFPVSPDFDVNYGDLAVCQASGNLFLVSSIESTLVEFTPGGTFVDEYPLPAGVTALSAITLDPSTGDAWVGGITGGVWRIGGVPCRN
jgi:hypothetical protein